MYIDPLPGVVTVFRIGNDCCQCRVFLWANHTYMKYLYIDMAATSDRSD